MRKPPKVLGTFREEGVVRFWKAGIIDVKSERRKWLL